MSTTGSTLVQTTMGAAAAASSPITLTLDQTTVLGSGIVVFTHTADNGEQPTGVTDDAGNVYVNCAQQNNCPSASGSPPFGAIWMYVALNAAPATQVTVTWSANTTLKSIFAVREYANLAYGSQNATQAGGGTPGDFSFNTWTGTEIYPDGVCCAFVLVGGSGGGGVVSLTMPGASVFGNFVSGTFSTDVIIGIADYFAYGNAQSPLHAVFNEGGTAPQYAGCSAMLYIEDGPKAIGGGGFGIGDGGDGGALYG